MEAHLSHVSASASAAADKALHPSTIADKQLQAANARKHQQQMQQQQQQQQQQGTDSS
jgi:hypothetical protein